ncbi:MAG: HlyD family type I secretion periplasmic adaptor subunit [Terricaulis sp.]
MNTPPTLLFVPAQTEAQIDDGASREGTFGIALIVLFFGFFGLWAAFAPLDAGIVANGEIKLSGNREVIQHRDGGVISRISVHEGDHVRAGQLLVELSATELAAQESALATQAIELEASRARLLAESAHKTTFDRPASWAGLPPEYVDVAEAVYQRQLGELSNSLSSTGVRASVMSQRQVETGARIAGYRQQIASIDAQAASINQELEGLRALEADGFAAPTRVRAVERTAEELQGQRAELNGLLQQAQASIGENRLESISVHQDRASQIAEELRTTDARYADIAPRLQATRVALEATRVRAPTDGRVVGLEFFNPGAVVRPGEKILELVPDEHRLVMEVKIRPNDADNVHPGQEALVRFSAFEGRRMPYANGRVERISADRFEDQRTGQPYFLADVSVSVAEQRRLATAAGMRELPLSPGLPVEVIIHQRQRTALQYLTEPLSQAVWRSFREN